MPLAWERNLLAYGFILASTRLLQWMMIPKKLGVIAIILAGFVCTRPALSLCVGSMLAEPSISSEATRRTCCSQS